jgi:hypothetical protein
MRFLDHNTGQTQPLVESTNAHTTALNGLYIELSTYLCEPRMDHFRITDEGVRWCDPLLYWTVRAIPSSACIAHPLVQGAEKSLPYLFRVAMDILPVQASSVPCERLFSSSKETSTPRRNRINPQLMEALQVLKFSFHSAALDLTMHMDGPVHLEG